MSDDRAVRAVTFLRREAGGVTTLCVVGELDISTLDALSGALDGAVQTSVTEMVVDLGDCPFLCSRSMGLIEASAFELQARGARLVVRNQPRAFDLISSAIGTYVFEAV